jgi:hypothetical protein
MIFISHRGNLYGPNPDEENRPDYINNSLSLGYDAEIDVWFFNNQYYLGHDNPTYKINKNFLKNKKLWCHAKNIQCLNGMLNDNIHCFWHQDDDTTLTSKGYLWTLPEKEVFSNSVYVDKNRSYPVRKCYGICSDFIYNK